ncbi:MAG: VWA domain-containing protein [Caldilineaceae bacterium]
MAELPVSSPVADQAVRFARYLRGEGLAASPAQTLDFVHGLAWIDISDRRSVRDAARAVFVHRQDELARFEVAFDRFWSQALLDPRAKRSVVEDLRSEPVWAGDSALDMGTGETPEVAPDRALAYSAVERLRNRDFGQLTAAEAEAIEAAIFSLAQRLPTRRSRRLQPARRGRMLDLRSTLRASIRTGGDPVVLARRNRRIKQRPIVLLCDVSGSMERYARILLQFAYALASTEGAHRSAVEAFVFATELTRVTPYLRSQRFRRPGGSHQRQLALDAAVSAARDWGGGTRIGACLEAFQTQWAPLVLGRGAVVLLISDGCDRGDIALLSTQIGRLRRRSHRLLWLNPWLGQDGYQPSVRGMQAALPHIDHLLPIHNLQSLEQLVEALARIDV